MKKILLIQEIKKTVKLGSPIVAAQLAHIALGFIDTVMAGRLSATDLAAVAIGRSLYIPFFIFVLGVLLALNPIVAQLFGAGKNREIGANTRQGIWLGLLFAIPTFFLVRNVHVIMPLMKVAPGIIPVTEGYLKAISWSFPAAFSYLGLRFFNEGISLSKPNMYFTVLALPVNILGNYALMYGHWGFTRLGAVGAGWATTIVWWLMVAGMLIYTGFRKEYQSFNLFEDIHLPQWDYIKEILRVGIPNGISVTLEVSMFAITALVIGSLGVYIVAAHQVAINIASITFMIPLGVSIAATSRVGFETGRESKSGARLAGAVGIGLSSGFMLFTAVVMLLIPELIVRVYTNDPDVINIAVKLIFFAAVFQVSDGLQVSATGALRGIKDTKIPMVINLVAYWIIGFPLGYYLGIYRGVGVEGFWMGWIAGLTFAAVVHPLRFYLLLRPKKSY